MCDHTDTNPQRATAKQIRAYLGHGRGNRYVHIETGGRVKYYGSTNDSDRSDDYWHDGGYIEDFIVSDDGSVCQR